MRCAEDRADAGRNEMNEGLVYRTLSDMGKIRLAMHKGLGFDPSFRYVEDAHLSALTAAMVVIQDLVDDI